MDNQKRLTIGTALMLSIINITVFAANLADLANRQDRYKENRRQEEDVQWRLDAPRADLLENLPEEAVDKELPKEEISFLVKTITVECETDRFNHIIKDTVKNYEHKRTAA